jgi:hypothetical protein
MSYVPPIQFANRRLHRHRLEFGIKCRTDVGVGTRLLFWVGLRFRLRIGLDWRNSQGRHFHAHRVGHRLRNLGCRLMEKSRHSVSFAGVALLAE